MAKKKVSNKGGRPPVAGERFTSKFIFDCHHDDKAAWLEKAASENKSLGQVIRDYLNRWVKR